MKKVKVISVLSVASILLSSPLLAAVSPEEAKQLGNSLTPWGAEKAGNKDGSIPEWTGQVKIPASYDPKKPGVRPDPFSSENPLFSITAQNMDKYGDKLSEGTKAMLKKYPTYRLDVYPSHRTTVYPQFIVNNSIKNATSCKIINNGLGLEGCYGNVPFPIPKTGNEAMWNHATAYETNTFYYAFRVNYVDVNGKVVLQNQGESWQQKTLDDPSNTNIVASNVIFWKVRLHSTEPARKAGEKFLVLDSLDSTRRAWQYIPGQRRVKLAPDLAFDTPSPVAGGGATSDDMYTFFGSQERYDFKLIGKKELFIPYNSFKMAADGGSCPESTKLKKNHINPDCMRWELHRVWKVEATLKPGLRHIYTKRDFYWDEDYPGAGIADNYDAAGKIYRQALSVPFPMYESQAMHGTQVLVFDLQTGSYVDVGDVADTGGVYPISKKSTDFFSPETVAGEGVR